MKNLLKATVAAAVIISAIGSASAAAQFVFRYKGVVLSDASGAQPGDPSTGEPGNGDGTGSETPGQPDGGSEGTGGGSGDGDDGSMAARMSLTVEYVDNKEIRANYAVNMPMMPPTLLAAPTGTYGDGDTVTVCWDTEINDPEGISSAAGFKIEMPPSYLVKAITAGGHRYEPNPDPAAEYSIVAEGSAATSCADVELAVPAADDAGWSAPIVLAVTTGFNVPNWWWARNAANEWYDPKEDAGAFDTTEQSGTTALFLHAQRVEGEPQS